MTWELQADGTYLLLAEGVNAKGERCMEKPQRLRPDGVAYPVEGLPGLTAVTTRLNPHTIRAGAKREDGSLAGEGTYVVAADGRDDDGEHERVRLAAPAVQHAVEIARNGGCRSKDDNLAISANREGTVRPSAVGNL